MTLFTLAAVALESHSRCEGPETVRRAFLANDPALIARCLPDRGRVLASGPLLAGGAYLGPGPLRAFLARAFAERRTTGFDVIGPAAPPSDSDVLHASARWRYRHLPSGRIRNDRISLTFGRAPENGEWRLLEIRFAR
jgi:hypothetical protein